MATFSKSKYKNTFNPLFTIRYLGLFTQQMSKGCGILDSTFSLVLAFLVARLGLKFLSSLWNIRERFLKPLTSPIHLMLWNLPITRNILISFLKCIQNFLKARQFWCSRVENGQIGWKSGENEQDGKSSRHILEMVF